MKKLFLASVVANVMEELTQFLPKLPNQLTIAFIPTAADPYEDKWFVDEDYNKLKEKGFNIRDIDIKGKTRQKLAKELKDIDVIFVAGGNTFYLLEKARESGFDEITKELVQRGIIYVGSSAGAIIVGPTIEPVKVFDDPSKAPLLKSFEGLNLVDFLILPHFKKKNKDKYEKIMREFEGRYGLILLIDNQAVVVKGSKYQVISK